MKQPTAKVAHNILYDVEALHNSKVVLNGAWHDTMVYDALIDENNRSYTLNAVAERRCGVQKDESLLEEAAFALGYGKNIKGNLWQMPPEYVGPYAEQDAAMLVDVFEAQQKIMTHDKLWKVAKLESRFLKVLWEMRKQGVQIDIAQALILKNEWSADLEQTMDRIPGFEIWSADSLVAFCEDNGYAYPSTDNGNPSFEAGWLSEHTDPTLRTVARARKLEKILRDFIDGSILKYSYGGTIRTQYHTTRRDDHGTRSGRLSSSNPNLQQIPIRDAEFGPRLRRLFIPNSGFKWGKFDYSSQEPRITLHFAALHSCTNAAEWVQRYRKDKSFDVHDLASSLVSTNRSTAKTVGLGITYGMRPPKLARELNIAVGEAANRIKEYGRAIPWIPEIFAIYDKKSKEQGYVETVVGRRSHIFGADSYKGLNRAVQGSGADMLKQAKINVYQEMDIVPLLNVHDETNYNITDEEMAWNIAEIMENALPLQVPAMVEREIKENWGV